MEIDNQNSIVTPQHPSKGELTAESLHRHGLRKRCQGKADTAVELISAAIRLDPHEPEYFKNLGNCYKDLGQPSKAVECYRKALGLNETYAEAYYDLGSLYLQSNQLPDAVTTLRKAIRYRPDYSQAFNNLALALDASGCLEQAIACLQKALACDSQRAEAWNNLGNLYKKKGDYPKARHHYEQALVIDPKMIDALHNLGQIYQLLGNTQLAIDCLTQVLKIDPRFIDAYINLGNIYQSVQKWRKAKTIYQEVFRFEPEHPVALFNLGVVANEMGDVEEAAALYRMALTKKPDYDKACAYLVNLLIHHGHWEQLHGYAEKLTCMTNEALQHQRKPAETPFLSLIRHADPELNFAVARAWSSESNKIAAHRFLAPERSQTKSGHKLRIGYLSNNFRNHPSADLICGILDHHNREEFETICYHYGTNDGSLLRRQVESACDRFVELDRTNDLEAAQTIRKDHPDILVDLMGHTQGSRMGICAYRPVSLQIRYLGFAGTSGADFYDYIITDPMVTPREHARFYTEKFILMPNSYHVNHYRRLYQPASVQPAKSDDGSGKTIVFCCFNATYKIDAAILGCWVEILKKVPNSVLWLLADKSYARQNLARQAEKLGIDSDRLLFFNKAEKRQHFERLRGADVALDTLAVSGAATTADALWAGVPVIAMRGRHFASSMSGSILSAAGLSDLVCDNRFDYIKKAVELGRHPQHLRSAKEKVRQAWQTAPIFFPEQFVRHLETAYKRIWDRYVKGLSAEMVDLTVEKSESPCA